MNIYITILVGKTKPISAHANLHDAISILFCDLENCQVVEKTNVLATHPNLTIVKANHKGKELEFHIYKMGVLDSIE